MKTYNAIFIKEGMQNRYFVNSKKETLIQSEAKVFTELEINEFLKKYRPYLAVLIA